MAAIENAVKILAPSFTFGIYDLADVQQEARMEGWRVLARYDPRPDRQGRPTRPLDNYIYTCTRNRLIRLRRDKLRRNDPPCLLCHQAEGSRSLHESGEFCPKYLEWRKRNDTKSSLMRPLDLDRIADERERNTRLPSDVEETAGVNEMVRLIDERLDVELRATYLQMRAGKAVPKSRRVQVENAVREILRDAVDE